MSKNIWATQIGLQGQKENRRKGFNGKKDNWKWKMNMFKTYTPLESIKKQINKEQINANLF